MDPFASCLLGSYHFAPGFPTGSVCQLLPRRFDLKLEYLLCLPPSLLNSCNSCTIDSPKSPENRRYQSGWRVRGRDILPIPRERSLQ
jgi:hypothetical protein